MKILEYTGVNSDSLAATEQFLQLAVLGYNGRGGGRAVGYGAGYTLMRSRTILLLLR